jgi:hypothetical protein
LANARGAIRPDRNVSDVDDGIDAGESLIEALACGHIDAALPGEHDRVVPGPGQRLYCMAGGNTRTTDDCYMHFHDSSSEHQGLLQENRSVPNPGSSQTSQEGHTFQDSGFFHPINRRIPCSTAAPNSSTMALQKRTAGTRPQGSCA